MSHPSQITDVILIIHGIRDRGVWQSDVSELLEGDGVRTVSIKYGYFDIPKFWIRGFERFTSWLLKEDNAKDRVLREIRNVHNQYPTAEISIIAHSFGTFVVSEIIQEETDLRFKRLIFCGSIVKQGYRWDRVKERITQPTRDNVINECGSRDIWPVFAQLFSFRYGASGTDGFGCALVTDRYHTGAHSHFLTPDFVTKYWVPFLKHGTIVKGDGKQSAGVPIWVGLMRVALAKTTLLIVVIAVIAYLLLPRSCDALHSSFEEFLSNKADAVENGKLDVYKALSVDKCISWACTVTSTVENEGYCLVEPIDEKPPRSSNVNVYFADPVSAFATHVKTGAQIRIKGRIVEVSPTAVVVFDAIPERLPQE